MELKDVILSTLAEMEEGDAPSPANEPSAPEPVRAEANVEAPAAPSEEAKFLEGVRERMLVLFEGFQSPNNQQIEAKVDLTLNFLEYMLATIDARLDTIKGKEHL